MKILESSIPSPLTEMTIATISSALRQGDITSVELVKACLERAEQGKELNVFITLDAKRPWQTLKRRMNNAKMGK